MNDQFILSATLVALLGFFIWGKFRYDAISIGALIVLVILGVIPSSDAFLGFAHPAVITVALVNNKPRLKKFWFNWACW